jgi:hypothetical protein
MDTSGEVWHEATKKVEPLLLFLSIGTSAGTAFVVDCGTLPSGNAFYTILATAWHVVADSIPSSESPLRCYSSVRPLQLASQGGGFAKQELRPFDAALVRILTDEPLFDSKELVPLYPADEVFWRGREVGWLGYPGIVAPTLCFYHGYISAVHQPNRRQPPSYLVDGAGVPGVSGGPVFDKDGRIGGIISRYVPYKDGSGVTLPGFVCAVPANVIRYALEKGYTKGVPNSLL